MVGYATWTDEVLESKELKMKLMQHLFKKSGNLMKKDFKSDNETVDDTETMTISPSKIWIISNSWKNMVFVN